MAVRNPRRDLSNGYLVAEICSRFWPNVDLHQYDNGQSKKCKESNWHQLRLVWAKNGAAAINERLIADVIECTEGAGRELIELLYSTFTRRVVQVAAPLTAEEAPMPTDFVRDEKKPAGNADLFAQAQSDRLRAEQAARKHLEDAADFMIARMGDPSGSENAA